MSRRGAALALTLVLLVVLECVVIGTMHLALQEHRIGANRVASIALRLEVENAVRRALGYWSASIDSMATGPEHRIPIAAATTGLASASVERLNAGLYIVRGEAREAPPRVGRAVAQLLVMPPLIGADVDPTPAPLVAEGMVTVRAGGVVSAQAPSTCADSVAAHAVLAAAPGDLVIEAGAEMTGSGGPLPESSILQHIEPLLESTAFGLVAVATDTLIDAPFTGILVVAGNVTLGVNADVEGLVLASGTIDVQENVRVEGAVMARGGAVVAGSVAWNPCVVRQAVALAGLTRPRPAGPRAWLPAF